MKIIIATIKSWNIDRARELINKEPSHTIKIVTSKEELTEEMVKEFEPDFIFFPHWSYFIPASIYENWDCVVFHMTDLPFGRGGSPLQNLIVRGIEQTKISAIKVAKDLDAGDIYLKEDLNLSGAAHEIFDRASSIIFDRMIPRIMKENLTPKPQTGEVVTFKRRTKEEGELLPSMSMSTIYDYIRMLDAEGYPNAFINFGDYRFEFNEAQFDGDSIVARVVIKREDNN